MGEKNLGQRYYTIKQVAEIMGSSYGQIYRMARGGEIPGAFRFGGSWKIPIKRFDSYLEQREHEALNYEGFR